MDKFVRIHPQTASIADGTGVQNVFHLRGIDEDLQRYNAGYLDDSKEDLPIFGKRVLLFVCYPAYVLPR